MLYVLDRQSDGIFTIHQDTQIILNCMYKGFSSHNASLCMPAVATASEITQMHIHEHTAYA